MDIATDEGIVLTFRGETLRFVDARTHSDMLRALEDLQQMYDAASERLIRLGSERERMEADLYGARLAAQAAERTATSLEAEVRKLSAIAEAASAFLQDRDIDALRTAIIDHEKGA